MTKALSKRGTTISSKRALNKTIIKNFIANFERALDKIQRSQNMLNHENVKYYKNCLNKQQQLKQIRWLYLALIF